MAEDSAHVVVQSAPDHDSGFHAHIADTEAADDINSLGEASLLDDDSALGDDR